ncbi:MAG TPA: hypothetical protein VGC06_11850 [Actinomycetes bacterium]
MLLQDKVAVIYGAGGAVARAFAAGGATLFLTGHKLAPVDAVAKEIVSAGGAAEAAEADALDEQAAGQAPAVGDRQDGPRRYLVQRDRQHGPPGDPGCPSGRAGGRAVQPDPGAARPAQQEGPS